MYQTTKKKKMPRFVYSAVSTLGNYLRCSRPLKKPQKTLNWDMIT